MHYEKRVLGFIDILGFKEILKGTVDSKGIDIEAAIEVILNIHGEAITLFEPPAGWVRALNGEQGSPTQTSSQFSDCIAFSCIGTSSEEVFRLITSATWLQVNLATMGILCRGGITSGKAVHKETLVFGPAMLRAYELEQTAVYPRCIVDESVQELLRTNPSREMKHFGWTADQLIRVDNDGLAYIDYFDSPMVSLHKSDHTRYTVDLKKLAKKRVTKGDQKTRMKYGWLLAKLAP